MIEGHVAHDVRNVLLDRVEAALELVQAMLAAVGLKQLGAGCVCPPVRRDASVSVAVVTYSSKSGTAGLRWARRRTPFPQAHMCGCADTPGCLLPWAAPNGIHHPSRAGLL